MYTLKLNVNPEGWRFFMRRKLDPCFADFKKKIFQRDAFQCQFCGLKDKTQHEVVNLDQNYLNNKISNLVTSCLFCTQCHFLEYAGLGGNGGGVLIYLPEIEQNYLNGFCYHLFSAMNNNSENKEAAENAYRHLKLRSKIIEDEWGENMSNPVPFGQSIIESGNRGIFAKSFFSAVRLLPSRAGFKREGEYV